MKYMDIAYEEALKAYEIGEIPVGCVIVKKDEILAKTHNLKENNNCAIDHAEVLAIKEASSKLNNWRLDECDIYITLSPCPMCASAIKQARIHNIYCGISNDTYDDKLIKNILSTTDNNSEVNIDFNIDKTRCGNLLKKFFKLRRFD
ncbi:MAG: nucleoside deaminase [Bacilli bacterium]|nr:nucleoside deaminase [Bacilli bacterium]MBQ6538656.1 nucleoside deaminase [Bacilli bacterium]